MEPDLKSIMNDLHPISLKHIHHIIERVSERYPSVPKYKTALIIRKFFETIRYLLIMRHQISINGLFPNLHLTSFVRFINNKYTRTTNIKVSTPEKMKNG